MRIPIAALAAFSLAASAAAFANPLDNPTGRDAERSPPLAQPGIPDAGLADENGPNVGIGVICNTSVQAETYVNLRAQGAATEKAMDSINREADDPKACGMAAVAYMRDKTMATTSLNGQVVNIVRINVIAGYDGRGWARVPLMIQYAVMESESVAI